MPPDHLRRHSFWHRNGARWPVRAFFRASEVPSSSVISHSVILWSLVIGLRHPPSQNHLTGARPEAYVQPTGWIINQGPLVFSPEPFATLRPLLRPFRAVALLALLLVLCASARAFDTVVLDPG